MIWCMEAYSLDLRQKILRASDQGLGSQRAIAACCGVSLSFVEKLLRRRRTTGDIAPRPHAGGRRPSCDAAALAPERRLVREQPDVTLAEFCERLLAERGLRVSVPTMGRLIVTRRLPRKKSRSTPANGTRSASSGRARPIKRPSRQSTPGASRASTNPA
jgi:transposase